MLGGGVPGTDPCCSLVSGLNARKYFDSGYILAMLGGGIPGTDPCCSLVGGLNAGKYDDSAHVLVIVADLGYFGLFLHPSESPQTPKNWQKRERVVLFRRAYIRASDDPRGPTGATRQFHRRLHSLSSISSI